jgi:hypothetical protein
VDIKSRISLIAVLLAWAAPFACSDDSGDPEPEMETGAPIEVDLVAGELTTLMCDAQASCDCGSLPGPADCAGALTPAVANRVARAQVLGLRYYEECLAPVASYLAGLGCRRIDETTEDEELANLAIDVTRCKPISGVDGIGDPCETVPGQIGPAFLGDTCAPGLRCIEGLCAGSIVEVGEACAGPALCPAGTACLDPAGSGTATCQERAGLDQECNPHDVNACDVDLVCDRDAGVCGPAPGPGEVCPQGVCATGSGCDGAICQPFPGDGDPCGIFGCADGLTCDFDTSICIPLPVGGEPCLQGSCAPGRRCGTDSICVDEPPLTCELPFCIYRFDGLCDEPEGTGLCADDTDPEDCGVALSRSEHRRSR